MTATPLPAVPVHRRIQGLDLLRGAAILLVLLRHSWPDLFGGAGIVGVVVFFTLSGYLITGLLADDVRRFGRIRYGRFYRNRFFRLIPALLFVLVGLVVMEGLLDVSDTRRFVPRTIGVALTYTMNIPLFNHGSPNFSHLWTLANEEQFYLVWPLIVFVGVRYRKLRLLVAVTAVVLVVLLVATVAWHRDDIGTIYNYPTTWTISMVVGAAAKLGEPRLDALIGGRRAAPAALVGAIALVAMSLVPDAKDHLVTYLLGGAAIGVSTVLVVWKLKGWVVVPRGLGPLVALGTISYAVYLWNYPISWWLRDGGAPEVPFTTVVLSIAAGVVSWVVVERPVAGLKARLETRATDGTRRPEPVPTARS
ncbi:acyltransferase family protein [Frigoribacterium sp. R86507]|uniref:acyltransferase family protein n=1 Tax=Frigoribacterium sp. R86507 TaxID=3093850 RepID=UPI0037CBCFAB